MPEASRLVTAATEEALVGASSTGHGDHQSMGITSTISKIADVRLSIPRAWDERKHLSEKSVPAPRVLPEPLTGASQVQAATLREVPDTGALQAWLQAQGVQTELWGRGDTKDVAALWKEIKLDEAGLELWRTRDGEARVVRVVHVLRAKVCTRQSFHRGVFLFNTWQQYADGRKRTRNGLLSEKVGASEMPIEEHLHDICVRAIAEELNQVTDASFQITPNSSVPELDARAPSPVEVLDEHFVDHRVEVEVSKSYPGLLTMYHLYTVEIVCGGLPSGDFNSLEFKPADGKGLRHLKYLHAWIWLQWSDIQRYLFEGSELKERKLQGSFDHAGALSEWLDQQCGVDTAAWTAGPGHGVQELFAELEHGKTQLELWGRHDGVPLLMRVVHVLQLEVTSTDPASAGRVLLQTWSQVEGEEPKQELKLLSRSFNLLGAHVPFNEASLSVAAKELVKEKLTKLADPHFRMQKGVDPQVTESDVQVLRVSFNGARHHVEESREYAGLCTVYHIYAVEAECEGLPDCDFGSVDRPLDGEAMTYLSPHDAQFAQGFRWVTWPEYAHLLRAQGSDAQVRQERIQRICAQQGAVVGGAAQAVEELTSVLSRLAQRASVDDADPGVAEAQWLLQDLSQIVRVVGALREGVSHEAARIRDIPPSMLSRMKENLIVAPDCVTEASLARRQERQRAARICSMARAGALHLPEKPPSFSPPPSPTSLDRALPRARLTEALRRTVPAGAHVGGEGIPVEALTQFLRSLRPEQSLDGVQAVVAGLAEGRSHVEIDRFVGWLYA